MRRTEAAAAANGWHSVSLSEILKEVDVRAAEAGALDAPVLSLTKNFGLIPQSQRFEHRVARSDVSDYKVVRRGWLVYNPYVIWEGAIHVLRTQDIGLVSPVYVTFQVQNGVDPEFLDLVIRSPQILSEFSRLSSGVVQRRRSIKKSGFMGIDLDLPPAGEQRRIADVLRAVELAQRASNRVLTSAQALSQSLMSHVFTYGTGRADSIQSSEVAETRVGLMPRHWHPAPIAWGLNDAQYGLSVRGEARGRVPMFRMNSLRKGRMRTNDLQYVEIDDATLARFRLSPGDVLFNRTNSFELVGKTALFDLPGEYVFASYLVRLRTNRERLLPEFLNYYLNWDLAQLRLRTLASRGVSQSNISASKLKAFEMPFPPIAEQRQIVDILRAAETKVRAEERRLAADANLFTAVLDALTSSHSPIGAAHG